MINVTFQNDTNTVTSADGLYQWDVGQILRINGLNLSVAPKVHFATKVDETAYVVQSEMNGGTITVGIPDKVLTHGYPIIAYVYLEQGTDKRTIKSITIPVIKRAKPNGWRETNSEDIIEAVNFYEQLTNDLANEMQELRDLLEAIDSSGGGFVGHMTNTNNPHAVTAEQIGARPDTWMPTASDVGAFHYILEPQYAGYTTVLSYLAYLSSKNINGGSFNAINCTDVPDFVENLGFNIWFHRAEAIVVHCNATYNNNHYIRVAFYDGSKWLTDWINVSGDFKSDGSVPMSGERLWLNQKLGSIYSSSYQTSIVHYPTANDNNNSVTLFVRDSSSVNGTVATADMVKCSRKLNGATSYYKIFGEHNITCGTSDITAGTSALTTGCYYDVYK